MIGVIALEDGDPELMAELILETLSKLPEYATGVVVTEWIFVGPVISPKLREDLRFKGCCFLTAPVGEHALLAYALALTKGSDIRHLIFRTDLNVDSIAVPVRNTSTPTVLKDLLDVGHLKAARDICSTYRRQLKEQGGPFRSLFVEKLLGAADVCEFLHAAQYSISDKDVSVLFKRGLHSDLKDLFESTALLFDRIKHRSKEVAGVYQPYADFLAFGNRLFVHSFKSGWSDAPIFVWLSVFFLRGAKRSASSGHGAQAIVLTCRALECYGVHHLISTGEISFDGDKAVWENVRGRPPVTSTGKVWEAFLASRIADGADPHALSNCTSVISLRNRSLFAHGIQNAPVDKINQLTRAAGIVLAYVETLTFQAGARWTALWNLSEPVGDGTVVTQTCTNFIDVLIARSTAAAAR